MSQYRLNVGDQLPTFEAFDCEGNPISDEDILGSLCVIYFYPKDDTPGCTKQACSFRDQMHELDANGVLILGVSPDNALSHQKFTEKYQLNFPLLCDSEKKLCHQFDVLQEKIVSGKTMISIERSTYLIDEKGIIRWIERPVQVENHIQRVLKAIHQIQST